MWVKMRGGAGAWVPTAETRRPVSGCRFFRRMPTTSTDVQLHRAMRTASIGLGPCVCAGLPSNVTVFPFSVLPSKTSSCFHSLWAIIFPSSLPLAQIIRYGLGVDGNLRHLRAFELEAVFKCGDHLVHLMHAQVVRERAVAREVYVVTGATDRDL